MTMTRQHFALIAKIIAMCPDPELREGMARLFGHGLQGTNPRYDRKRFEAAAMRQPTNGPGHRGDADEPPFEPDTRIVWEDA